MRTTILALAALIARKILADTEAEPNLSFTQAELDGPFAR